MSKLHQTTRICLFKAKSIVQLLSHLPCTLLNLGLISGTLPGSSSITIKVFFRYRALSRPKIHLLSFHLFILSISIHCVYLVTSIIEHLDCFHILETLTEFNPYPFISVFPLCFSDLHLYALIAHIKSPQHSLEPRAMFL